MSAPSCPDGLADHRRRQLRTEPDDGYAHGNVYFLITGQPTLAFPGS